jgi:hypothetical protein
MVLLFRLPYLLLETLLRRLMGRDDDDDVTFVPAPTPTATPTPTRPRQRTAPPAGAAPAGPPPPTAEEAIARRVEREAAPAPAREPSLRAVADNGHVETEATVVESFGPAGDVGSAITVDPPWEGYDGMAATAVVQRVRGSDEATKAVVRLYEQQHKARMTVLRATG